MEKNKGNIVWENGKFRYFDKKGEEIHEGDKITFDDGSVKEIYLCEDGQLGIDATNPVWIEDGRASKCDYGIYPLEIGDCNTCVIGG